MLIRHEDKQLHAGNFSPTCVLKSVCACSFLPAVSWSLVGLAPRTEADPRSAALQDASKKRGLLHSHTMSVFPTGAAPGAGVCVEPVRSAIPRFPNAPPTDSSGICLVSSAEASAATVQSLHCCRCALSSTKAAALTGSEVSPVACPDEVNSGAPIRTSECVYRKDEK